MFGVIKMKITDEMVNYVAELSRLRVLPGSGRPWRRAWGTSFPIWTR